MRLKEKKKIGSKGKGHSTTIKHILKEDTYQEAHILEVTIKVNSTSDLSQREETKQPQV